MPCTYDARNPAGIKYILATQCSNPQIIKSITGSQSANTLPASSSAAKEHQTAMHTRTLQRIPRKKASPNEMVDFVTAVFTT